MNIVIFAGGTLQPGHAVSNAITTADLVIAADKGATAALQYGCTPNIIVGDLDSLVGPALQQAREHKSQIIQAPVEKNETDTELAIQLALQQGATTITLLGGLGGARFDHTMANVQLLVGFLDFSDIPIRIVDGPAVCWLLRGPGQSNIHGHVDDLVSLLPLTAEATNVKTQGLYYPLHGETLHFGKPRGVSNHLIQEQAEVSLDMGMLLLIHTDAQELDEG